MSESKYVLAMYDVRGKQDFIFRTNRLTEIVGASWIIRDVFEDYLYKSAEERGKKIFNYRMTGENSAFSVEAFKSHMNDYIGEVLYEGGGNFLILFKDIDTFRETTYYFTKKLMEEIGTLQVLGTCVEIENFDDFNKNRKELYERHRINEAQESIIAPWSCIPIVQVDRKTSQPLVVLKDKLPGSIKGRIKQSGVDGKLTKESAAKLIKYYSEIDKINNNEDDKLTKLEKEFYKNNTKELDDLVLEKGTDSQLAVVYIDGNNMGTKAQAATQGISKYEKCIASLREFSDKTQELYVTNGVEHALSGLSSDKSNGTYRIVVSAGDEINFIVNAHDAFICAKNYLDYLRNEKEDGASACAGIAVFHSHAPYADVYRIAEEACESGKQKMKEAGLERASFIDFHICQGAIGTSLEQIRDEENGRVISRPWMMWKDDEPGNKKVDLTDYVIDVQPKLNYLKTFARTNIKGLISASKEGVVSLQMELNRMYGHARDSVKEKQKGEWKKLMEAFNGPEAEKTRNIIYDLALSYDLWFAGEDK